jgi:hypothetical protein
MATKCIILFSNLHAYVIRKMHNYFSTGNKLMHQITLIVSFIERNTKEVHGDCWKDEQYDENTDISNFQRQHHT